MHSIQEKKPHSLLFHITEVEFGSGSCMPPGLQWIDEGIMQKLNIEQNLNTWRSGCKSPLNFCWWKKDNIILD